MEITLPSSEEPDPRFSVTTAARAQLYGVLQRLHEHPIKTVDDVKAAMPLLIEAIALASGAPEEFKPFREPKPGAQP